MSDIREIDFDLPMSEKKLKNTKDVLQTDTDSQINFFNRCMSDNIPN